MDRSQQESVIRTIVEKAVAYGRMRKSSQSGFLHFHYGTSEDAHHGTIPLQDNFLYVMALLRSRTIDNITEAKELLEKLLHFQIGDLYPDAGAFPIYLHDFPQAKDRYLAVPIGIIFCYILRDFAHVIGQELRDRLRGALKRLVKYIDTIHTQTPPPFRLQVALAALHVAAGKILEDKQMSEKGESILQTLEKTPNAAWYSPKTLGQVLSALSLVYPALKNSPWKDLWTFADMSWHRATGTYVGPPFCQWQVREELQVTLYDLFMSAHSGILARRAMRDSHTLLEAAIIYAGDDLLSDTDHVGDWSGEFGGSRWLVHKGVGMAYAGFDGKPEDVHQNQEKGFHNFVMFWGDRERVHSLGCQRVRVGDVECNPLEKWGYFGVFFGGRNCRGGSGEKS